MLTVEIWIWLKNWNKNDENQVYKREKLKWKNFSNKYVFSTIPSPTLHSFINGKLFMVMEWYGIEWKMEWNEIFCIIWCNLILWLTPVSMWCVVTRIPPSWLFELCALSHVLIQQTNLITHETIHLIYPKIMLIHRFQCDLGWVETTNQSYSLHWWRPTPTFTSMPPHSSPFKPNIKISNYEQVIKFSLIIFYGIFH